MEIKLEFERVTLLKEMADKKGINSNIFFLGERKDATAIMGVFDCFIMPSHREGFPLVLCEAQAQNVRSVVSNAIPDDAIINDNCFTLGVDESSEKWADYILGTFSEPRNRTLDSVDIKNAVNEHISVYEKALKNS